MFQSDMRSACRLCWLLWGYESAEKTCLSFSSKFGSISGAGKFLQIILKVCNDLTVHNDYMT